MHENLLLAFSLTLFAGIATGVGSAIAFFCKTTNTKALTFTLSFSAGVMLYVSFVEIFQKALSSLTAYFSNEMASYYTVGAFFAGIFFIAIIDLVVTRKANPHEMHEVEEIQDPNNCPATKKNLYKVGLVSALAIGIHNFPEGLATFVATLQDPSLGASIAVAIAMHNIPEGIAVSIPIYYATGKKSTAFLFSFLSGLAEPVGAVVGYFLFIQFFSDLMFGLLFASVAGIMVYISLDELLPAAEKYGEHHLSIIGVVTGMLIMAVSLLLFI